MGADIHMWSEAINVASLRNSKISSLTEDATAQVEPFWECATPMVDNPYYDPAYKYDPEVDDYYDNDAAEQKQLKRDFVYGSRSYRMFTLLANVRNYDDGDFNLIPVRGIPKDITEAIKAEYDRWGSDAHTPSWATLAELEPHRATFDAADPSFMRGVDELRNHRSQNTLEQIRVVFWFDN